MKSMKLLLFVASTYLATFAHAESPQHRPLLVQQDGVKLHASVDENIALLNSPADVAARALRDIFLAANSGHDKARDFVVKRRLDYPHDKVRYTAMFYLHSLIKEGNANERRLLLPVVREALNDEDSEIRGLAVAKADETLSWADDIWPADQREDAIDELIDLVATKLLMEPDRIIYNHTLAFLKHESLAPNHARLKSLQRAMERLPKERQRDVQPIEVKWRAAVFGLKLNPRPKANDNHDPFAEPALLP